MRRIVEFDELLEQLSNELPINAELVRLHVLSEYSIDESAKNTRHLSRNGIQKMAIFKGVDAKSDGLSTMLFPTP